MTSAEVIIKNKIGLHARPASDFVKCSLKYKSLVRLVNQQGKSFDGKSIISVLSAGIHQNDKITISAQGDDEETAIAALVSLIENMQ